MCKIRDFITVKGIESLSLPHTRRTLDYILNCLQEEKLIRIFLSRTRPPRKLVILTNEGDKYLKDIVPKERVLFDDFVAEERRE